MPSPSVSHRAADQQTAAVPVTHDAAAAGRVIDRGAVAAAPWYQIARATESLSEKQQAIRAEHPRAFEEWTVGEKEAMRSHLIAGGSIADASVALGRQPKSLEILAYRLEPVLAERMGVPKHDQAGQQPSAAASPASVPTPVAGVAAALQHSTPLEMAKPIDAESARMQERAQTALQSTSSPFVAESWWALTKPTERMTPAQQALRTIDPRALEPWSKAEEQRLVDFVKNATGASAMADASKAFGRAPTSVTLRLWQVAPEVAEERGLPSPEKIAGTTSRPPLSSAKVSKAGDLPADIAFINPAVIEKMHPAGFSGPEHKAWIMGLPATDGRAAFQGITQTARPVQGSDGHLVMPLAVNVRSERTSQGRSLPAGTYYVGRLSANPEGVISMEGPMTEWKGELSIDQANRQLIARPKGLYDRLQQAGASVNIVTMEASKKAENGEVILLPHVVIRVPPAALQAVKTVLKANVDRAQEDGRYAHKPEAVLAAISRMQECHERGDVIKAQVPIERYSVWPRNHRAVSMHPRRVQEEGLESAKSKADQQPNTAKQPAAAQTASTSPSDNYVIDATKNPNPSLTREKAIEYLVDGAINSEETEWVGASVLLHVRGQRTEEEAKAHVREMAALEGVRVDEPMVDEIFNAVKQEMENWP